jgi:hypothetical protein
VDEGPGRFPERSFASQCGRARAYPQAAIPTVEVAQSWKENDVLMECIGGNKQKNEVDPWDGGKERTVETVCILSEDDQKINNNKPGNKIIVS